MNPGFDAGGWYPQVPRNDASLARSDGTLVVAGRSPFEPVLDSGLFRILPDGRLDFSFGAPAGLHLAGTVEALAEAADGSLLAGGRFTLRTSPPRLDLVALDRRGRLVSTFVPAEAVLRDRGIARIAVLPDGRILVGKRFQSPPTPGAGSPLLFRLLPDGALDPEWSLDLRAANSPALVNALLPLEDGRVLVGGRIPIPGGSMKHLIRLLPDGRLDPEFIEPASASDWSDVIALEAFPGGVAAIVLARNYSVVRLAGDGQTDPAFADWRGNPALHGLSAMAAVAGGVQVGGKDGVALLTWLGPTNPAPWLRFGSSESATTRLASRGDGSLLITGDFGLADGYAAPGILRVLPDGSRDANFARPGSGLPVRDAGLTRGVLLPGGDGSVLVGGSFTEYNGRSRNHLARLGPDGALDAGFDPELPARPTVRSLALTPDGAVLVVLEPSPSEATLVRLQKNGRRDPSFHADLRPGEEAMRVAVAANGWVYVETLFSRSVSQRGVQILRLEPDGSRDPGFAGTTAGDARFMALHPDGRVLATVGNRFLRLLTNGAEDPGFARASGKDVYGAWVAPDDSVVAAGGFDSRSRMSARWMPSGLRDPGFRPPPGVAHGVCSGGADRILLWINGEGLWRCLPSGPFESSFRLEPGISMIYPPVTDNRWAFAIVGGAPKGVRFTGVHVARFDLSAPDLELTELGLDIVRLRRVAPSGSRHVLERSGDLSAWMPVATNNVPLTNVVTWSVPRAADGRVEYFRTVEVPP